MRKNQLSLAAPILLLAVFVGTHPTQSAQPDVTDEEYNVYSAILRAKHEAGKTKTVVIIKTTSTNEAGLPGIDDQKSLLNRLSPLTKEALNNYNARNNSQVELSDRFDLKAKAVLVDDKEIYNIIGQQGAKGWDSFYKRFPDSGGFIKFSRVGFDAGGKQALLFVSHSCGGRCASGIYYVLEKESNEWKIRNEHLVWVS